MDMPAISDIANPESVRVVIFINNQQVHVPLAAILKAASDVTVTATSASLAAIGNAINTTNKRTGKLVWNSTTAKLYRSRGPAAGDLWDAVDGSGTITPV